MKPLITLVFGLIISISGLCQAKPNTSQVVADSILQVRQEDSILNSQLTQTSLLLKKSDSLRRVDSIYKVELLRSIESLRSNQEKEKDELLLKIKQIDIDDSIRKVNQRLHLLELKATTKGFPVAPFEDTLFFVYSKIGPLSPSERAKVISNKIESLIKIDDMSVDSIFITTTDESLEIWYKDQIIMSISDFDAMWFDKPKEDLAKEYREIIISSVRVEQERYSLKNTLIKIGLVLLILLGAFFLIRGINYLFKFLEDKLWVLRKKYIKSIKVRNYELLDEKQQQQAFDFLIKWIRIFVIIIVIYLTLPLLFSIFPWTKEIGDTLLGWIINPLKNIFMSVAGYLPNLFTILVIILLVRYLVRAIAFLAKEIGSGKLKITGFYPDWAQPTFSIVKVLLYAFMFVIIFPYLPGSDSDIFKGVSVFLGILFSLGSTSAIANVVAGYVITYMRPFKVGDRIKIADVTGDVIEKTVLVTRIRTTKNEEITVPNSNVLSGLTVNYSTITEHDALILHTTVTIGYDVPWRKVHELLINAALDSEGILKEPAPFVLQTSLDDFFVSYQINAYTKIANKMARIYSELHQNIQDKFNEANVEILSPHYEAQRDGESTRIQTNFQPKTTNKTPDKGSLDKKEK